ncbi:NAD(P)-dependent oxidoreductase [Paraburkholderia rhynchosiae]|uniref:2-hydroxy-3-oxopropionate reductase n=1 Tax=Paraburkholderia rhynchosiae TaxID=487049 RepID=A0A2N7VYM4_9BURK|nr:NAD(P)-dependent oxidoreductase [Paraburkholderia rhynchosiae]PMS22228.1 NAD(P)-dependent oxidoreductase [Paraburkholderia rhynchosiae]CAB3738444.1 2-hydroxy-3-oxopropionate reductase [Paraburkholderia rhynchosiae]
MPVRSVCVIGAGAIGAPVARRILEAGFELTVCDQNAAVLASFAGVGVTVTRCPADCATSDLVLIAVATAEQVTDVVTGNHGILSGLRSGPSPIIAIMSTVGPRAITDLEKCLEMQGVRLIDAPVSGGALRAQHGRLTMLVGGAPANFESAKPVLETVASRLFHCGAVGAAQTIKLVNNVIAVANLLVTGEAYRLALDNGLALDDVTRILDVSSGRNHFSAHEGEAAVSFASWTETHQDFDALTSILGKDLALAQQLSYASSGAFPFMKHLASLMDSLDDETFMNWHAVGGAKALTRHGAV